MASQIWPLSIWPTALGGDAGLVGLAVLRRAPAAHRLFERYDDRVVVEDLHLAAVGGRDSRFTRREPTYPWQRGLQLP